MEELFKTVHVISWFYQKLIFKQVMVLLNRFYSRYVALILSYI